MVSRSLESGITVVRVWYHDAHGFHTWALRLANHLAVKSRRILELNVSDKLDKSVHVHFLKEMCVVGSVAVNHGTHGSQLRVGSSLALKPSCKRSSTHITTQFLSAEESFTGQSQDVVGRAGPSARNRCRDTGVEIRV